MTPGPPPDAPSLPGRVIFDQRWLDVAFLHWPVDPQAVERYLPPGVRPDVWTDGLTYVGLVPFRMARAGFGRNAPMPYFGSFLEWNVRLYSVDDAGRHGVVFRTLDATRLAVVGFANAGHVPYRWARIRTRTDGDEVRWRLRRFGRGVTSRLGLRIGERVRPSELEVFLTARWGMHGSVAGRTIWVPNAHERWPLYAAEVLDLDDQLVAAAGVPVAGEILRPLWSPGVHARFAVPQVVERPSGDAAYRLAPPR